MVSVHSAHPAGRGNRRMTHFDGEFRYWLRAARGSETDRPRASGILRVLPHATTICPAREAIGSH